MLKTELTCSAWFIHNIEYQVFSSLCSTFLVASLHHMTRSLLHFNERVLKESIDYIFENLKEKGSVITMSTHFALTLTNANYNPLPARDTVGKTIWIIHTTLPCKHDSYLTIAVNIRATYYILSSWNCRKWKKLKLGHYCVHFMITLTCKIGNHHNTID